jgi:hypothetical protein
LGKPDVAIATLRRAKAKWEGAGKAISGEDDGVGPGADHAPGDDVPER